MRIRSLTITKRSLWHLALLFHFFVALNADLATSRIFWWGSIILLLVTSILNQKGRILLIFDAFSMWMVVFIILVAISASYALNSTIVFSYLKSLIVMLVIYYAIYISIRNPEDINNIIWIYLLSTVIIGLYLMAKYNVYMFALTRTGDANAGNWNANSVGMMMSVSSVLSITLFSKRNPRWKKVFLTSANIFFIFWIVITASRKAIIMLIIGLCAYFILLNPKKIFRNILLIMIFLMVVYYLIMEVPTLYNLIGWRIEGMLANITGIGIVDNSTADRQNMINLGVEWFKERPILGYGMDNYRVLYGRATSHQTYAHNNFIELAVDLGILGVVVYYWIFVKIIKDFICDKQRNIQKIVLFVIVLMYLVSHYALVAILEFSQNPIIICVLQAQRLGYKALPQTDLTDTLPWLTKRSLAEGRNHR